MNFRGLWISFRILWDSELPVGNVLFCIYRRVYVREQIPDLIQVLAKFLLLDFIVDIEVQTVIVDAAL